LSLVKRFLVACFFGVRVTPVARLLSMAAPVLQAPPHVAVARGGKAQSTSCVLSYAPVVDRGNIAAG